jgi:hypothetical protein
METRSLSFEEGALGGRKITDLTGGGAYNTQAQCVGATVYTERHLCGIETVAVDERNYKV